jgi:hypothetical protein
MYGRVGTVLVVREDVCGFWQASMDLVGMKGYALFLQSRCAFECDDAFGQRRLGPEEK